MGAFTSTLYTLVVAFALIWVRRGSEFDYTPQTSLPTDISCPKSSKDTHIIFGGTSVLGKHLVKTWKRDFPDVCLINYSRKKCELCDVSISGDIRDSRFVEKIFHRYANDKSAKPISTVILSVKPDLTLTSWKTFMGVNYQSLVEITEIAKRYHVSQFLYTSSIASSSHFVEHKRATEDTPQPLYTDYNVPYDLSKRMAEDYILKENSKDFKTIALRVSGILGGEGDPFFHHRAFPFLITFNSPTIVDYGYAGNIADAMAEMYRVQKKSDSVDGQFYYYTGEHILENATANALAEITGKPLIPIPHVLVKPFLVFWQWFRWDHEYYTLIDLVRLAEIEQTFDQSKFHKTFPNFKPRFTVLQALEEIYGKKKVGTSSKQDL